jgi:hypothetical protein
MQARITAGITAGITGGRRGMRIRRMIYTLAALATMAIAMGAPFKNA